MMMPATTSLTVCVTNSMTYAERTANHHSTQRIAGTIPMKLDAAVEYHARHKPQALLVLRGGETLLEQYDNGFSAGEAHALYSGTKSFWGVTALIAQRERLLSLDE